MNRVSVNGLSHKCSQIVLGTSFFRAGFQDLVFEIADTYVENGGNVLDTSSVYGFGDSERIVAKWLKTRKNRNDVLLITKACHHFVDEQGVHYPEKKRVNPACITEDLHNSLDRMEVDYFDMFLLHRDDVSVPVGELLDVMQEHKNSGLIKAYGVSNWSTDRIDEAMVYTAKRGYDSIALNSPSLSLAKAVQTRWQGVVYADDEYISWHERTQLPLFSWAAQASGFFYFAGQYKRKDFLNADIARVYYSRDNLERLKRITALAQAKGGNVEPTNVALAYVLNQAFPTCAVIGPQKPAEVLSSIKAAGIRLTEDERLWINLQK